MIYNNLKNSVHKRQSLLVKAIIFDMDGVLLDSMPMHIKVWKEMFEKRNIPFSLKIFEDYNGTSTADIAKILIKKYNLNDNIDGMVEEKHSQERVLAPKMLKLFDETIPTIIKLKKDNYKIAVATSALKETVDYVKNNFDLFDYFDEIVFAGDVEKTKPFPDLFLLAAKRLGVEPSDCCVIEDAINGIEAANTAGMCSVAITTTFEKNVFDKKADMIISSLAELDKKLIKGE